MAIPETTLVLGSMIVSEVRMFFKQMNETNNPFTFNFELANTHEYHQNYSINIQQF